MVVVSDTTTLSNLLLIDHSHLLQALYHQIILPYAVAEELRQMTDHQYPVETFLRNDWVIVKDVQRLDYVRLLRQQLDTGESAAIALAVETNADLLIVDEKKGRTVAKAIGLHIIGTLGILVEAKQRGLVPSVGQVIDRLRVESGFWVREELRKQVLESVGEL